MEQGRREVHPQLRKILAIDAYLTEQFVKSAEKNLPLRQLKVHYRLLEISAHGILWFAGWLAFIWILNRKDLYQMQINLFLGLLSDVFLVAVLKAITRRRRPSKCDDPFAIGPDKYSFPSGHASRSTYITFFFFNIWPVSIIIILPLFVWTICVCLSRILMKRHHILDIFAGVILGIFNGLFISVIFMGAETCVNLVYWLTDEKLDGGEYHV